MTDERDRESEKKPEPGSAADLFPDPKPGQDPVKEIREKGEPGDGDNFA